MGRGAGERGSPGPRSPGRARAWRTQPRRHERCRAGVKERAGRARSAAPSAATDATQKELRKTQGNLAVQEPKMVTSRHPSALHVPLLRWELSPSSSSWGSKTSLAAAAAA